MRARHVNRIKGFETIRYLEVWQGIKGFDKSDFREIISIFATWEKYFESDFTHKIRTTG